MSSSPLRSVFEYLEQLPGTVFRRLYQQPAAALAIFRRMLPHLAKSFVMAMLYSGQPLPATDLDLWVRPSSRRQKDQAIAQLERLYILTRSSEPNRPQAYKLTNPFASSLRLALTGGGNHQSFGVACDTPDRHSVDIDFLDSFARRQWEGILHYIVGNSPLGEGNDGRAAGPSQGVTRLLEMGGLVVLPKDKRGGVEITQSGFSFLLQEANAQVWALLIFYLENAENLRMDPVEVLSFFFTLGGLTLGQDYSTLTLTATQSSMLEDLRDFGLIYRRKSSSKRFYPTRLATTLTSDVSALRSATAGFDSVSNSTASNGKDPGRGFIIMETNYRLYAYTSSPLQMAVLALFAKLSTRYPNMVAGRITRDSIRGAIATGITSDQIITYLSTHAHPQMLRHQANSASSNSQQSQLPTVLPSTVVDQIRLWQIEGERMKATTGFLFKDFASWDEYAGPAEYAEEIGVLVWRSDRRRMFFVTRHEQIAGWLKSRRKGP